MSRIYKNYVVTPSVALYGSLSPDLLVANEQSLIFASHAFLSRAAFHGAILHVPMLFYSQVIEAAFATYQEGYIGFEDCQGLARAILESNWEYHIISSDDILTMQQQFKTPSAQGDAEYLAIAQELQCPIVTTQAHPLEAVGNLEIVQLETHVWASAGAIEDFPPNEQ